MIRSRTGICSLLLRYGLTILALILFLQREVKPPPSEFETMDYVFDWIDDSLVLVRSPL